MVGIAEFERLTGRDVHLGDVIQEVELSVNDRRAGSDRQGVCIDDLSSPLSVLKSARSANAPITSWVCQRRRCSCTLIKQIRSSASPKRGMTHSTRL